MSRSKKITKVPVTMRALIQRINRKLRPQEQTFCATRGPIYGQARNELGDYYVRDWESRGAWPTHVDPEDFGRKLGVLRPWERVVEDNT
jgi:hypothetical protein